MCSYAATPDLAGECRVRVQHVAVDARYAQRRLQRAEVQSWVADRSERQIDEQDLGIVTSAALRDQAFEAGQGRGVEGLTSGRTRSGHGDRTTPNGRTRSQARRADGQLRGTDIDCSYRRTANVMSVSSSLSIGAWVSVRWVRRRRGVEPS